MDNGKNCAYNYLYAQWPSSHKKSIQFRDTSATFQKLSAQHDHLPGIPCITHIVTGGKVQAWGNFKAHSVVSSAYLAPVNFCRSVRYIHLVLSTATYCV